MRRHSFRHSLFAVLLSVAFAGGLVHADVRVPSADFSKIIPAPPADDSPAGMADLETVLNVQKSRTEEQIKEAKRVDSQSAFGFARPVLGEWYRSEDFPEVKEMIHELAHAANEVCEAAKKHWNRPRPYQRDPRVEPVTGRPGNASYPSGHSFGATFWSIIYAEAFPEYAKEFDEQAQRAMWGRVIAGVHYPTDTTAGYILAHAVGEKMLQDPEVKKKIRKIREEIERKRPKAE
jgi:Membrane-associated phospholipid phosphatase